MKYFKWQAIVAPIFKIFEAIFALIVPVIVKNIIDKGINGGLGSQYIIEQGLILLVLALIGFCSTMVCQILAANIVATFGYNIRNDLYKHINTLSFDELDRFGASTLQTRISSDIVISQTGLGLMIRLAIRAPFLVIGSIIMAFIISPKMAWIFILAGVLLSLVIYFISKLSLPYNTKIQSKLDDVTNITKDNMTGTRVVRAFNKQKYEQKRFYGASDDLQATSNVLAKISSLLNPLSSLIVNAALIAILYLGSINISNGTVTSGDIVALANYMNQISLAIVAVANLVVAFSKAQSSSIRIDEVFNAHTDIVSGTKNPAPDKTVIRFDNVTFKYSPTSEPALKNISFEIVKDQTIGIIGGTGSGKSTIADLIDRFYDATSGNIFINGIDIREYDLQSLRHQIGFVHQKAVLFSGTIRSNLIFGNPDASEEEIKQAIMISQSEDVINEKTDGLDSAVEQEGKNFSGGQRQRLAIARALIKKPSILILDDSSSALDFQTDFKLRKALKESTKNLTVLIISQRANAIRYADNIIVLEKGDMVGNGTHDELYATCPIYRGICDSQISSKER